MKRFLIFLLAATIVLAVSCDSQKTAKKDSTKKDDQGHHHHEGAHGGNVLDSGGKLHVELVHKQDEGKVSLYILGGDGKTPQKLEKAPTINLKTADGPKQIESKKVGDDASHYEAADDALKGSLKGRIVVNFEGKPYNLDIKTSHDHEGDGGHGHGHGHGDGPTISHTAWTDKCEWFVELETPEKDKAAGFTAHVTLLKDFSAATEGSFTAKATSGSQTAAVMADKPARTGIFTPKITFPASGKWNLQLTYKSGDLSDTISYEIEVYEPGKIPDEEEEEGNAISFLKEQQWKISFATVWSKDGKVPGDAVVKQDGKSYLYVQLDGESFEKREVKTSGSGDWVKVEGLTEKVRVATKGMDKIK